MLAERDPDLEGRGVVRAVAADEFVSGDAKVPRRGEFLERRLGMGRGAALAFEHGRPVLADEGARGIEAMFEEHRAEQRLDDVADDIVAGVGLILTRLLAEADEGRDGDRAANFGAAFARHQRIVAAAHLALGLLREAFVEPFGDDQPEDAVAEEFQPLIAVAAKAAVGQRALVKPGILERDAEQFDKEGGHGL